MDRFLTLRAISLRLGILIDGLKSRVPHFWLERPGDLAKQLLEEAPELAEKIVKYDPVAFGFVARIHRFLAKGR